MNMNSFIVPLDTSFWLFGTLCDAFFADLPNAVADNLSIEVIERTEGIILNLLHNDIAIRQYTFPQSTVLCFFEDIHYRFFERSEAMDRMAILVKKCRDYNYHVAPISNTRMSL